MRSLFHLLIGLSLDHPGPRLLWTLLKSMWMDPFQPRHIGVGSRASFMTILGSILLSFSKKISTNSAILIDIMPIREGLFIAAVSQWTTSSPFLLGSDFANDVSWFNDIPHAHWRFMNFIILADTYLNPYLIFVELRTKRPIFLHVLMRNAFLIYWINFFLLFFFSDMYLFDEIVFLFFYVLNNLFLKKLIKLYLLYNVFSLICVRSCTVFFFIENIN